MENITEKLGITEGFKREHGDNLIRNGVKYSNDKYRYSLKEMMIIDAAPDMLEALIEDVKGLDYRKYHGAFSSLDAKRLYKHKIIIEEATGKSWEEIKKLLR